MRPVSIHVLTGDDESILRAAVNTLVQTLVGDGDRALIVDEFDAEDYVLGAVVDAAQTAPFLTDHRVVVARAAGASPSTTSPCSSPTSAIRCRRRNW